MKTLGIILLALIVFPAFHCNAYDLPDLPPMPPVPHPLPVNSVCMGNSDDFEEVLIDIPVAPGPFAPDWESIERNYPGEPSWLRDAKFGIWVHFGPQSAGESGDWYARNLYKEGHRAYANHCNRYGHPSEVGYKDVLHTWNPAKLNPDSLTALYKRAGARFLMIQGVHHDNYDLWNSQLPAMEFGQYRATPRPSARMGRGMSGQRYALRCDFSS